MKSKIVVAVLIAFLSIQNVNAQLVIKIRPTFGRVVRTNAPSNRHVWIEEDWACRNNNYAYTGGYWSAPPRGRSKWIPGHWKNTRRGWVWKPGHWR
jgi:WXXGXW repeat (2 copies)